MVDDAAVVPVAAVADGGEGREDAAAEQDPRQGQAPVEKPSLAQLLIKVQHSTVLLNTLLTVLKPRVRTHADNQIESVSGRSLCI